jgi:uncharacterized RDD family membrane protein YckC
VADDRAGFRDVLVTPDAVVLDLETVGVGTRSIALLIDLLVLGLGMFLTMLAMGVFLAGTGGQGGIGTGVVLVLVIVLPIGYPMVLEATWNGRTLGKAAMGLRVVTTLGGRIGWREAAMRAVIGFFELWVTLGAVAFIAAFVSERGQRLGDVAAGTLVIRTRTAAQRATPLNLPPAPADGPMAHRVATGGMTTAEYGVVRGFVERMGELEPARRRQLAEQLVARLSSRIGPPPAGTAPEDWLVAAVRNHQHAQTAAPPPMPPPPPPIPPSAPPPA